MTTIILVANSGLWLCLLVYVTQKTWLTGLAWRAARRTAERPVLPAPLPTVTVQLPVYNEPEVIERLLCAVGRLSYPRELMDVQVLDDSNDATPLRVQPIIERLRKDGLRISHLQRSLRTGYKAGALAAAQPAGEFVLILDADFVPNPDVIERLIGWFAVPQVAMVQARWGHLTPPRNAIERSARYWVDRHFQQDQVARSASGHFFHFNGSAGMWRQRAIDDAGGWTADTLAEDLDLSLRAWLRGWRFVYDHDTIVPASLPPDAHAFLVQQSRWARGAMQVARKHAARLWRAPADRWQAVRITLHTTEYAFAVLLLGLSLMSAAVAWARLHSGWLELWTVDVLGVGFVIGLFGQTVGTWIREGRKAALLELEACSLGIGLAPRIFYAALAGLLQPGGEFVRTPRVRTRQSVRRPELLLAILVGANAAVAMMLGAWSCVSLPAFVALGLARFALMRG